MGLPTGVLQQIASAIRYRGALITIRRAATTGGQNPVPIPPNIENPVSAGAAVGDTSLIINCAAANGQLIAGDQITFGGITFTVTGPANSNALNDPQAGFSTVPITPSVAAAIPAGTVANFSFVSDQNIYANIGSFSLGLIDNTVIQSTDLNVAIASWDSITQAVLPPPKSTDSLIINGSRYGIVNVFPQLIGGTVVRYNVQARA